jgi:hypothetical protein
MAHETAGMTSMEDPTNAFGEGVTGINSSRCILKTRGANPDLPAVCGTETHGGHQTL